MTDVNASAPVTDAELDGFISNTEYFIEHEPNNYYLKRAQPIALALRAARATLAAYEVARGSMTVANMVHLADTYADRIRQQVAALNTGDLRLIDPCLVRTNTAIEAIRSAVTALVVDRDKAVDERDRAYAALREFGEQAEHNAMVGVTGDGKFKIAMPSMETAHAVAAAREAWKGKEEM